MTDMGARQVTCLMIVRLNNFRQLRSAFGEEAAEYAMDQLLDRIAPHFAEIGVLRAEHDEIEIVVRERVVELVPPEMLVDGLCSILGSHYVLFGDMAMILSPSAGCAMLEGSADDAAACERARTAARQQLRGSSVQVDYAAERGETWAKFYRQDMAAGAALIDQINQGDTFFSWRPVCNTKVSSSILHHEAHLCRLGQGGQWVDCEDAYQALKRLGLTHVVDQKLVSDVLDDLEADAGAQISIPISAQSLSFHFYGHQAGWTMLRHRLGRNRKLANRLIIEIDESAPLVSLQEAQEFVTAVQALGARITLGRFGAGYASIGQLLTLTPDFVKLDSAFLRTAFQSDRHRARLGHLLGLARTIGRTVIVDGADSALYLNLAIEEGIKWVTGSHMGNFSLRRSWSGASGEEQVVSLAHFKANMEQAANAAEHSPQRVAQG